MWFVAVVLLVHVFVPTKDVINQRHPQVGGVIIYSYEMGKRGMKIEQPQSDF